MMILTVSANVLTKVPDLPSTRAVRTVAVELPDDTIELRLELQVPGAASVFTPFVEDVASAVTSAPDDEAGVLALIERFLYWRRLLSGEITEGLGAEAAQGLWGELWVLRYTLHPIWGDEVVASWTGPEGDDNDFRRGRYAVEVKTLRGDRPAMARITSERQLDNPAGTTLFLIAVLVDRHRHGAGESLPEMVGACLDIVTGPRVADLRDRLLAWGYSDAHRGRYEETRYSIRAIRAFRVDDGFPRLTESVLPDGVGSVSYNLSLDACATWAVDATDLPTYLADP
jgi:hypothetical protein